MNRTVFGSLLTVVAITAALPGQAANPATGRGVYEANCAICHGPQGIASIPGAPNFRRNERLEKPDPVLLMTIRSGIDLMPAWKGILSEQAMADALAYIRTLSR